jgi:hypothetical protein
LHVRPAEVDYPERNPQFDIVALLGDLQDPVISAKVVCVSGWRRERQTKNKAWQTKILN